MLHDKIRLCRPCVIEDETLVDVMEMSGEAIEVTSAAVFMKVNKNGLQNGLLTGWTLKEQF